jgi:hypothetical protein
VAVAGSRAASGLESEMYSWAGDRKFDDRDLLEMVPDGSISTGSYFEFLASIFGSRSVNFSYNGDHLVDGKLLAEFGYKVPTDKSTFTFWFGRGRRQHLTAGYEGTFFIDPETSDLVRLTIRSDQLPPETRACEVSQTVDYSRVHLNETDFLLPREVSTSAIHVDGTEMENHAVYASCQEFRGESTLKFEQPREVSVAAVPTAGPKRPADQVLALPAGLPFKLVFTQPIDTGAAAAGDTIRAKLETPIRDKALKILVQEGAVVTGRIVKLLHSYGVGPRTKGGKQHDTVEMVVKLESMEVEGAQRQFKAQADSRVPRFGIEGGLLSMRVDMGPLDTSVEPNVATFHFDDVEPHYVVESGLESKWLTLAPEAKVDAPR